MAIIISGSDKDHLDNPSLGFRGWYGFNDDGKLVEGGGVSYVLSTMLGVTSNNGIGVDDVVAYLKRSARPTEPSPPVRFIFAKPGTSTARGRASRLSRPRSRP